jgi:DNA-binding IclR family transcriptional regulator
VLETAGWFTRVVGLDAVDRMASVLGALRTGTSSTLNEVCDRTGLPRSTASRFLNALAEHDFVYRSSEATFSIGAAPGRLALAPLGKKRLGEVAHPHMRRLADHVQEAVCLSVLDGIETQTIHQVGVPQPVFVENWVDRRWPILSTGSAISIMSTWSPTAVAILLDQLPKKQRPAITESIAAARSSPLSWSQDDYVKALTSVSAPILNERGYATSAVIIYGPSYRFPNKENRAEVERRLHKSAAAIAKDLY